MPKTKLKPIIKEVAKLIQKHHLDYEQLSYITKEARKAANLKRRSVRNPLIVRLTNEESKKLLYQAYTMRGQNGLLIKTLLFTGSRVSEFVEIAIQDFLPDSQSILIRKAKGGKHRVVPITEPLSHELMTHIGLRTTGYLFESNRHHQFTPRRIQQLVKEVALRAGITKRVYPHLLRHTVATFLLEQGMPLDQIQMFLGHERIENTQIYAKNSAFPIEHSYKQAMKNF